VKKIEATSRIKLAMERNIETLDTYLRLFWEAAYQEGYSAGYAARDKLSCVNCGDGGKVEPK
jgi:hypothetical protein